MNENVKNLEGKKRAELLEVLEQDFGKTEVPTAKMPKNPKTKDVYDYLVSLYESESVMLEKTPTGEKRSPGTKADKKKQQIELSRRKMKNLIRVVVTDTNPICSLEDSSGIIEFKTFGNTAVGFKRAKVLFDKPWIIPEFLVETLEAATYTASIQKGNEIYQAAPVARYNVMRLPQLTQGDINNMVKKQSVFRDENLHVN